jgi:hypothetical protein
MLIILNMIIKEEERKNLSDTLICSASVRRMGSRKCISLLLCSNKRWLGTHTHTLSSECSRLHDLSCNPTPRNENGSSHFFRSSHCVSPNKEPYTLEEGAAHTYTRIDHISPDDCPFHHQWHAQWVRGQAGAHLQPRVLRAPRHTNHHMVRKTCLMYT